MLAPHKTNHREGSLHVRKQDTVAIDMDHLNISCLMHCNLHMFRNILQ